MLRTLSRDLRNTREPSHLYLASSLETIISSIENDQVKLTNIFDYRARMREFYSMDISKERIKELYITKHEFLSLFIDPRSQASPLITKRWICMDWCRFQLFKDHWMDTLFMVFDKPPCNSMEAPLYFLMKLWEEFMLGHHGNYFDISDFLGVDLGSSQD